MIAPRLRAGLVLGAVVVASAIAGAAIDRALIVQRTHRAPGSPRRGSFQEQEDHRRTDMLDRLTTDLSLTPAQRAGLDSVFRRTDSSLRAVRRETQPRIQQIFQRSREEIDARLDSTQRAKFASLRRNRVPDEFRGGRARRGAPGEPPRQ